MCGILGHFAIGGGRVDERLWHSLVNLLAHRGPDDSTFWSDGRFAFGHRRLSIIELSSAGRQPMATEDGQLVVTFNGEIYNYIELRDELAALGHRFQTRSDTEVLLHGYRQWGTDLPARLRGMFAFAIADRRHHELFVARDRFGEKPLFVHGDAAGVSFASEVKVLAALPDIPREVNEQALGAYLCLNYVPGDDSMLRGVCRIRPATWRLWTAAGRSQSASYWRPPAADAPELNASQAETAERLEHLLDNSARLALRSDVPVGVLLSGGIDSSLVARSAARSGKLSSAYCLTFGEQGYSEWPKAERTARHLGVPLVEVRLDASSLTDFHKLVEHADDPLADSSALAVWTLSRAVARETKVVLSGDGGDELFGGYLTYQATMLHERVTSRLPAGMRRTLARAGSGLPTGESKVSTSYKLRRFLRAVDLAPALAHFTWNGTWLPDEAAALLREDAAKAGVAGTMQRLAWHTGLSERPTLRQLQLADISEYLPNDILTKSDRMSMAHGLEVRSPFLDPELADFALRLPDAAKLTLGGATKRALRDLARRAYDVQVAGASKQGFSIPVHAWLRGPARPLVEDLLDPGSVAATGALDAAAVSRAVRDHMSGRRSFGFELWGLAVFVAWHRRYIQRRVEIPEGHPLPEVVDVRALAL